MVNDFYWEGNIFDDFELQTNIIPTEHKIEDTNAHKADSDHVAVHHRRLLYTKLLACLFQIIRISIHSWLLFPLGYPTNFSSQWLFNVPLIFPVKAPAN